MLTVKLIRQDMKDPNRNLLETEIREVACVRMHYEKDGRQVISLGDLPQAYDFTVGENREDVQFTAAFVMNSAGNTVEVYRGH